MAATALAPLLSLPLAAAPALAATSGGTSYQANLQPLNNQTGAGGTLMLTLNGNQATVTEDVHGLASTFQGSPFPHVQHIHGLAQGTCPSPSADTNGDDVVSTPEAQSSYGAIQTTLSVSGDTSPSAGTNVKIAPSGSSYHYSRTITLSSNSIKAITGGTAVIVVHGDDPTKLSAQAQGEKSALVPSLPLAATAPALCGALTTAQMGTVPSGGASTGGGSTSGVEDAGLLAVGVAALAGAGGALAYRRRTSAQR